MERYNARKVDDLGRIVLHGDLRRKLGFNEGSKVKLTVIDSIVVVQYTDTGDCEVSDIGMIIIPAEIRKKMSWVTGSEIAVYNTDSLLILKTA